MFDTKITPQQYKQEKYTHILICYKCYKLEDHAALQCTSPTQHRSECSSKEHTYQQYTNLLKQCLNCQGPHRTLAANCPCRKNIIRQKEETEQRQKQEQTLSADAKIAKHAIQQTNPRQQTLTLTNQIHIKLAALILEVHIAALDKTKKIGDILTLSLKLNFNIDTTFPDRDSTAIFNFYYDKTDSPQPQMTQTAPQEEHTIDQTIETAMDETDAATFTKIKQKTRINDGMKDSTLLMDNKYTTYVKICRNYEDSSPIPDNPTKDWFANKRYKDQDNDKGLKLFTQDLDHQPVVEMLKRRRALFLHTKINIIPHEQFITLPGYHTTNTTIKN
ncbi:hypothetical protein FHG87_019708 [Trinorchestia longiramus]|nr:hypothetical protein FHG87_019708 [Trinorchestia longiramus]